MPSLRLSPPHTVVNSVEGSFSISGREISIDVWSRRLADIPDRRGGRWGRGEAAVVWVVPTGKFRENQTNCLNSIDFGTVKSPRGDQRS